MSTNPNKPHPFHRLHALRMENDEHAVHLATLRPRFEALKTRHEDGTAPRAVSAWQLFQTPPPLAERLAALAEIQPGQTLLEPSAGLGRLLDAAAIYALAQTIAVEVSPDLCRELYAQDRPNTVLRQADFLTIDPETCNPVDRVVMNPPFHMRADIKHTLHALRFLRPGGRLAGLCLDTRHREEALRPLADTWEPIPAGAFASEGTRVPTVLFSISTPV